MGSTHMDSLDFMLLIINEESFWMLDVGSLKSNIILWTTTFGKSQFGRLSSLSQEMKNYTKLSSRWFKTVSEIKNLFKIIYLFYK